MPIRLLHTADLHLGIENYGRLNPATGLHQRLEDYLRALDFMVDHAIAERLDVFLVAGDIYHTKTPSPTAQREFAARVRRLTAAGIAVVLLVGNHDAPGRHSAANPLDLYASLETPGVTILREPKVVTIETAAGSLQVAALPHITRSYLAAQQIMIPPSMEDAQTQMEGYLDDLIFELAEQITPGTPAVLTAHLAIAEATAGSEDQMMLGRGLTLPLRTVANRRFQYVAMGHIHKPQVLDFDGFAPPAVYPGSPERVDFGEERDEKSFQVVALEAGGRPQLERVALPARPFITIRVDLREAADPTDRLAEAIVRCETAGAVVRLAYTLQADRQALIDEPTISRLLADAFAVAWRPDLVQAADRVRLPEMSAAFAADPLAALDAYIASSPDAAERRDALMACARTLMAEIAGESLVDEGQEVAA